LLQHVIVAPSRFTGAIPAPLKSITQWPQVWFMALQRIFLMSYRFIGSSAA